MTGVEKLNDDCKYMKVGQSGQKFALKSQMVMRSSRHDGRGNKKQTQRKGNHCSSKISEKITRTFLKYSENGAKYQ